MTPAAEKIFAAIEARPGIEYDDLRRAVGMEGEALEQRFLDATRELDRAQLIESTWADTGEPLLFFHPLGRGHQLALEGAA